MDHCFWEDDFAYFEVDLLIFEDFDLFYPPAYAYILEDVDGDIDDG